MAKMLMLMLMLIRGAFSSHVLLFIKQRQDGVEERAEEDDQERRDQRAPHAAAFLQVREFHETRSPMWRGRSGGQALDVRPIFAPRPSHGIVFPLI